MNDRVKEIYRQIAQLQREKTKLIETDRKQKALDFIRVNNVTLDDVEMSFGGDKEWFWTLGAFGLWLKHNSQKRFAEWNERIYWRHDLIEGKWHDTGVYLPDLKEME